MAERFPVLAFPAGVVALHEPTAAGCIDPREPVLELDGAARGRAEAVSLEETGPEVRVLRPDGTTRSAPAVAVAAGAFLRDLLPRRPEMTVHARAVALLEVDEAEVERLRAMPSIVHRPADRSCDPWILPPIRHPHRRIRLKIGGDPQDRTLESDADVRDRFRSGGDPKVRDFLGDYLKPMPDLKVVESAMDACVTSVSSSGLPPIRRRPTGSRR